MDELFESLTLIQTGKIRNFPVVLVGTAYWSGLLEWLKARMVSEGKISAEDLDLIFVTDSPEAAVAHVVERYRSARPTRRGPGDISRPTPRQAPTERAGGTSDGSARENGDVAT